MEEIVWIILNICLTKYYNLQNWEKTDPDLMKNKIGIELELELEMN